ncbi:RNA polymerase sigma factor [Hyalangium versicolor]|uniref:RNA polymerase sigma factor n=1 Tax=Hyalangium versicolor TaxID=2861190 RepID=UPI001CCA306F|nr:RNA polymerase sigma factor [Hyalangium versicolor]
MARSVNPSTTGMNSTPSITTEYQTGSAAFAVRYRNWLLAQARNVCGDANDAEDLAQEVLLRFLQTFDKREAPPNGPACETWLSTTLTRLFYDQCRRRKVRAHWARDPHLRGEFSASAEPVMRPIYDGLTDEQFAQALRGLSPKLRATFELHAAGQKYQDIAQSLGLQVGTVSKRLHDARARLHKLLRPHTRSDMN